MTTRIGKPNLDEPARSDVRIRGVLLPGRNGLCIVAGDKLFEADVLPSGLREGAYVSFTPDRTGKLALAVEPLRVTGPRGAPTAHPDGHLALARPRLAGCNR
jgi:hypothetical protein